MNIYLGILKFNFYQFVHYPLEMIATLLTSVMTVAFLYIFWSIFLTTTGSDQPVSDLIGYFLVVEGLSVLTMAFKQSYGAFLRKGIKSGDITAFLIKPIKLLPSTYLTIWGSRGINNISAIIILLVGIYITNPINATSYLLFGYFLFISFIITFSINLFEGVLTFHITEPGSLMSAASHIMRILSGAYIPLYYFPDSIRGIVEYLPFSMMIYTPIEMLSIPTITSETIKTMGIGAFWAVLIFISIHYFWKKGLKKYEAIGL